MLQDQGNSVCWLKGLVKKNFLSRRKSLARRKEKYRLAVFLFNDSALLSIASETRSAWTPLVGERHEELRIVAEIRSWRSQINSRRTRVARRTFRARETMPRKPILRQIETSRGRIIRSLSVFSSIMHPRGNLCLKTRETQRTPCSSVSVSRRDGTTSKNYPRELPRNSLMFLSPMWLKKRRITR